MGVSTKEEGMLKLVHPGRKVEIHTEPITAAEVMRKNPRNCIARPDVFKFPWIVVRPESVLYPGNVFYIVPYRTIYRLLKDRGCLEKPSSRLNQTLKEKQFPKQVSNLKSRTGLSRMHPSHDTGLGVGVIPREQESDESLITQSKIESWVEAIFKNKHTQKEVDLGNQVNSPAKNLNRRKILPKNENCDVQLVKSFRQTNLLKSCLRKPDSTSTVRKLHKFRVVTFASPITSDVF